VAGGTEAEKGEDIPPIQWHHPSAAASCLLPSVENTHSTVQFPDGQNPR